MSTKIKIVNNNNNNNNNMFLQTSDNIFAVRSLSSLYLIDTKPPFLQLMQCCILNLQQQGHVVSKLAMLYPYRERIASQKCYFDILKPKSIIGSVMSQYDTPFSMFTSSNLWIFLMDYFLIYCTKNKVFH